MIEFRALGSLAVVVDGQETSIGGPRQRRLLAMLLINHDDVVSVDRLADAVFAGEPSDAARTTMRSYIARIRRVLGDADPDVELVTKAPGYALRTSGACFDVTRFEQLLEHARREMTGGDAAVAVTTLRDALALWAGSAYAEFADEEWVFAEAQRLEELRLVAIERLGDAELACGRAAETIPRLDALVAEHPLREAFRAQQMLALYRAGRQADALRAFRAYRETLIDEIGLEPSPNLVDLERRILDHDPTLELEKAAGEPLRGYRLGRRLGAGPNGIISIATVDGEVHERTISILEDARVDEPDFVANFETRAQQIASLTHPAVVALYDYWRQPGTAYVVSRRVANETLRDRLGREPLTRHELIDLATRIGGALAEAADRGIEHGWVTLDNIVAADDGFAITNFVVCPRTGGHDVADFAAVLTSCVRSTTPPLGDAQRAAVDASLTAEHPTVVDLVRSFVEALTTQAPVIGRPPNPYKGLRAFDETDSEHFHGREALVATLADRVTCAPGPNRVGPAGGGRLTMVVGGSGSGKSSVVRAGLIPAVRRQCGPTAWFVTTMLPGGSPFKELAEAIRRIAVNDIADLPARLRDGSLSLDEAARQAIATDGRLLLVIDQFEELFTLSPDADHAAFLDLLTDAVESPAGIIHVVGTLRADFYDRPLTHQRFGPLVGPSTVAVAAMTAAELEAAIVDPIESIGSTAETALVAELVAAVSDQAAALPALQFTLYELAERRPDRALTLADFHELGGLDEAIASRAEQLYVSHDDDGRQLVRSIFEQLVAIDVGVEATGRRSPRAELLHGADPALADELIERWTTARLLSSDHDPRTRIPTVQVAHEALLRSWPRLRQWIIEDRELILEVQHLREAAANWVQVGRDEGALYRGTNLGRAVITCSMHAPLPPLEQEFLDASVALRDREEREATERVEQQQRANRRLRFQLAAIAAALVVALVVGFLAIDQRGQAREERDAADAARRDATARELASAADANVDVDPERAIHLALASVDTTRAVDGSALPEAVDALHRAVTASRVLVNVPDTGGRLDWSPIADEFVTEGPEESGIVDIRSAVTGESLRSWRGDAIDVNDVVYSRDGTRLAVAGDDGILKVYDPSTGELLASTKGTGPVWDVSFDADGRRMLAFWPDEPMTRLIDTATGDVIGETAARAQQMELRPDGAEVAIINPDGPGVGLFEIATEQLARQIQLDSWANEVRWSPDGEWLAAGTDSGVVRVFAADTGDVVAAVAGHDTSITGLRWSRDGTALASGSNDGTARVWDFDGEQLVERQRVQLDDLANGVPGLAFSSDGTRLAVGDWAIASTKIVDLSPLGGAEIANVDADPILGVGLTGDELIVANADDGLPEAHVLPSDPTAGVSTGDAERRIGDGSAGWPGLLVDPAGERVIVPDESDGTLVIRDLDSGEVLATHDLGLEPALDAVAWSGDGERIAYSRSTGYDPVHDGFEGSEVVVIDAAGRPLAEKSLDGIYVSSVALDGDGSRLAWTNANRVRADPTIEVVSVWDWQQGEIEAIPVNATDIEFDPTGRLLAATRFNDGRAELFDAITLAPVATLSGATTPQQVVTFGPDGLVVATGGRDGTIRLWDTATGEEIASMPAPATIRALSFNSTGDRLASLDESGVARVWTLDLDELIAIARDRVTRDLTDAECQRYLQSPCPSA